MNSLYLHPLQQPLLASAPNGVGAFRGRAKRSPHVLFPLRPRVACPTEAHILQRPSPSPGEATRVHCGQVTPAILHGTTSPEVPQIRRATRGDESDPLSAVHLVGSTCRHKWITVTGPSDPSSGQ
ncbi:hypothetical protein T484DRAFT_3003026 [Baffinella frigidus]|nr:hypothetical protein T484DRAFT_3003026 [Cryptophyta sp. CCMP2293]